MMKGSYTALVTPFKNNAVDYEGLEKLVDFQIKNGMTGILAVGTTGESPVLSWEEHNSVIDHIRSFSKGRSLCIAGTGSNNTKESLEGTAHAKKIGADAVLLVDPYYNGPSSLEIRKEYIEPIAKSFPDMEIIPYVIPGRTGTQLLPEDLAILAKQYKNVRSVKEATGNLQNMKRTRECCGPDYSILSGDDGMTYQMMVDPNIKASGVISVISNIAPKSVSEMVTLLASGKIAEGEKLQKKLDPLFSIVTVKTTEKTSYGDVTFRARNPLPVKTLMAILGMPGGICRQPLGKLTFNGLQVVLNAARKVHKESPEIFKPIAEYFGVNIEERLNTPSVWENLYYKEY